tara:strand:- start:203 stop:319 length:117 start_codon:yes stop_codon:yes gene_type:complete
MTIKKSDLIANEEYKKKVDKEIEQAIKVAMRKLRSKRK